MTFQLSPLLQCLRNRAFARLYAAQAINLIGDAFTWLGLGLLAFELAGENSGLWLSTALTLRVVIFVLLAPMAGVLADRLDRKGLMVTTHLVRMVLVSLFPFVSNGWQLYWLVALLSGCHALFTPTYTATLPLITTAEECPQAIALSNATYQLLSVLGPALAGSVAALFSTCSVFFLDALTFLVAAVLIAGLPTALIVSREGSVPPRRGLLEELSVGSQCLWWDAAMRYGLLLQLVAAIAGAEILVNTVGYVQGTLQAGSQAYGSIMAALGVGATLAAVIWGSSCHRMSAVAVMGLGGILTVLPLLAAYGANVPSLALLWAIAGIGKTLVNVPMQTVVAERVAVDLQGRVYGAQFAWSHLWWVLAYPLAGWFGSQFPAQHFFYAGLSSMVLFIAFVVLTQPWHLRHLPAGFWHSHPHDHSSEHDHCHRLQGLVGEHQHLHFHCRQATAIR
ncbi:MFS transporter [Thermosynechococcus sichuanensis E542]|uniref:MFS transporter n=1 Tax=Thermosynechococcus sichuanensis E542 TaxID=2016101 RepID=A0A7D6IQL6_9CYAN|nr:MFS transporter [Thermosynechococcus vestitus]QLL29373.1 MFS transporter [Thermosynechococcus vestitus E542]